MRVHLATTHNLTPLSRRSAGIHLYPDDWNDFWGYRTMYQSWLVHEGQEPKYLGEVKIGEFDWAVKAESAPPGQSTLPRRPALPDDPSGMRAGLPDAFFSLGQSLDYYANVKSLGDTLREDILRSMRDVAFDLGLYARIRGLVVTHDSIMRSVTDSEVRGQFHRVAVGGIELTDFAVTYVRPSWTAELPPAELRFDVYAGSDPPTNVHALIGSNGVGKTRLLGAMADVLLRGPDSERGSFTWTAGANQEFTNLVAVSFSAFDRALPVDTRPDDQRPYQYVGLRSSAAGEAGSGATLKSAGTLADEFRDHLAACVAGRHERWASAISTLEADPLFAGLDLRTAIPPNADVRALDRAKSMFADEMSSGHAIVLLSVTALVATVEERSLVLIDEPEAHLHPPLLSAFVRALSDLLTHRNGVALIATHSPVVLQEVPASCVQLLERSGDVFSVERPLTETFGESISTLTAEIFKLQVTETGFNRLITEAAQDADSYEEVLQGKFAGKLGAEGRAILRTLVAARRRSTSG